MSIPPCLSSAIMDMRRFRMMLTRRLITPTQILMKTTSQSGFAIGAVIGIVAILALLGGTAYVATRNNNDAATSTVATTTPRGSFEQNANVNAQLNANTNATTSVGADVSAEARTNAGANATTSVGGGAGVNLDLNVGGGANGNAGY